MRVVEDRLAITDLVYRCAEMFAPKRLTVPDPLLINPALPLSTEPTTPLRKSYD